MSEKPQKQEAKTRDNLPRFAEKNESFKNNLDLTNVKPGAIDKYRARDKAITPLESQGLNNDLNLTNTESGAIDSYNTRGKVITLRKRSPEKQSTFIWAALVVPIVIFFVLGSIVAVRMFLNDQQSGTKILTTTQKKSQKQTNSSKAPRKKPVLSASPISKQLANTNPRKEKTSKPSPGMHKEPSTIAKPNNLPKSPSNQPASPPEIPKLSAEAPQSSVQRSDVQKWQGSFDQYYTQYDTRTIPKDSYPMALDIENVKGAYFTGKLRFETLDNTITEVKGEFVTKFDDNLEERRWSYLDDFRNNNRDGTWGKFTQTRILKGGNLGPKDGFIINDWYYLHIRNDGSIVGVYFDRKENTVPAGYFSLTPASN